MAKRKSQNQKLGFSLVELLVVIAIIGILAALLLPVLTKAQGRAKRVWCENDLRQMGIAFHTFCHDHNSQFPMAVPMIDGGSQELTLNGYLITGPFYFGYRHFQTLSNLLVTPKILACPTDTAREAAANFGVMQNSNVSYFVGVTADYNKPNSILAGDANLVIPDPTSPTLQRDASGYKLQWTRVQHVTGGNVLFSDGHSEEWATAKGNTLGDAQDFVLPTIRPFGVSTTTVPSGGGGGSSPSGGGGGGSSSSGGGGGSGSSPPNFPSSPSSPPSNPSGGTPSSPSQPGQPSQPQPPGAPSMPTGSNPTPTNSGVIGSPAVPGKPSMPSMGAASHGPNLGAAMSGDQTYNQPSVPSTPHAAPSVDATNIPTVISVPETNPPAAPPEKEVKMQKFAGWIFLILMLLLLFLIFIAFQIWRKAQEAEKKKPRR